MTFLIIAIGAEASTHEQVGRHATPCWRSCSSAVRPYPQMTRSPPFSCSLQVVQLALKRVQGIVEGVIMVRRPISLRVPLGIG